MADTKFINAEDLGLLPSSQSNNLPTLRKVREQAETQAIRHAFNVANGNLSKTADLLGVTRPTLYSLIDKYKMLDLRPQDNEQPGAIITDEQ